MPTALHDILLLKTPGLSWHSALCEADILLLLLQNQKIVLPTAWNKILLLIIQAFFWHTAFHDILWLNDLAFVWLAALVDPNMLILSLLTFFTVIFVAAYRVYNILCDLTSDICFKEQKLSRLLCILA